MSRNNIIIFLAVIGVIFTVGCAVSESYSEEELGVRKSNLYEEKVELKDTVLYSNVAPGESKLIKRSYENAPPLIPHSVEGFLPITKEYNSCLSCHSPEVASAVKATPIPKTHLISYRPVVNVKNGEVEKDGKKYVNTSDILIVSHERGAVSTDRYNCTQCHVPQTNNKPLVENNFRPYFREKSGEVRSNLADTLNEGVSYTK